MFTELFYTLWILTSLSQKKMPRKRKTVERLNFEKNQKKMSESNFQELKDENFNDCATIASSLSSNKSFRQRLREKFVFSNSNSHEIGQKAMEMKIENLESELQSKNQEIKEHKAGIQSAGVLFKELKSKLKEKDKELNGVRAQLCNEEDFSSIKSLLESQKDSIIQSCMEMLDNKEESPVVIKVGMEMNDRKMASEIAIHKEEIAVFKSQSDVIRSEIGQKDLDLGKMQREVEDLKTELVQKDKKIEEQQVEIESRESKFYTTQLEQMFRTSSLEIETSKAQLEQERQNSKNVLKNSGPKYSEVENQNSIRPEAGQKELRLEEMQKRIEDLEKELQLKNKEIEDQQVEIDTISVASMEFKYFKAEVEQERQQQIQNSKTILQNLGMRCSEIEFMKTQLEQERQNSVTVLQNFGILNQNFEIMKAQLHQERQNFGILNQNFELLKAQFGQEMEKDLQGDLEKMQKEMEDLKTELQLKDKKIEEQQVDIETIMDYYRSHVLDD